MDGCAALISRGSFTNVLNNRDLVKNFRHKFKFKFVHWYSSSRRKQQVCQDALTHNRKWKSSLATAPEFRQFNQHCNTCARVNHLCPYLTSGKTLNPALLNVGLSWEDHCWCVSVLFFYYGRSYSNVYFTKSKAKPDTTNIKRSLVKV